MSRDFFSPNLPFAAPSRTACASPPSASSSSPPLHPATSPRLSVNPIAPHTDHRYVNFVSLSPPSGSARSNGLLPVRLSQPSSSSSSARLPFAATPPPHEPLLSQLNDKVTAALQPVAVLHNHLLTAASSLSLYMSHSSAFLSSLHALSPSPSLNHYTSFHHALHTAHSSSTSYYSVELLYPLHDWMEDCEQLTVELGSTQETRHLLSRAQDELEQLFEMKIAEAVPRSVEELIDHSKEGLERLSVLYSGQVEGVVKSVERVLKGREQMLKAVGKSLMQWEWKVMKGWRRIGEMMGKKEGEDDDEGEEKEAAADEDPALSSSSASSSPQPDAFVPHVLPDSTAAGRNIRRPYSNSEELVRPDAINEEEELTALSPADSSSQSSDEDADDCPVPASSVPSQPTVPPLSSPVCPSALNFPYKAPCKPSVALTPLPWTPLPLSSSLSSSVWLSVFSSAYKWDESRDELVCQYEVRPGAGKEEVEKVWKNKRRGRSTRDKRGPAAAGKDSAGDGSAAGDRVRMLSAKREMEVERIIKRVGLTAQEVVEAILVVNLEKLTADNVAALREALPTEEEKKRLTDSLAASSSSSASLLANLSPASFLLTSLISPVQPSLVTGLHCLHSYYQLPSLSSSITSSLSLLQSCCLEIRDSLPLQHLLCAILEIFNFLHPSQVAYAFDLSLLAALPSLSTPSSPSFLTFLVSHLIHHHPNLLSFSSSLPSLHAAASVSLAAISSEYQQLSLQLSAYRSLLDQLDSSSDADDKRAHSNWLSLFDRAVEVTEKVEKRMAQCKAQCEDVCRWLCWTGRKRDGEDSGRQDEEEENDGKRLFGVDAVGLLKLLRNFVLNFNAAVRAAERRLRRKERFHVNVKEEKIKEALEQEKKQRRGAVAQRQQQQDGTHPAVLYSPYSGSSFSELHERHVPPAIESMTRNPSVGVASAVETPSVPPPQRTASLPVLTSPSDSPMRRATPVFSLRGSRSSSQSKRASESGTGATGSPSAVDATAVDGGMGLSISGIVYRGEVDDRHVPAPAPVKMIRMPYQSHFTYEP